jgi:hypothetical protein
LNSFAKNDGDDDDVVAAAAAPPSIVHVEWTKYQFDE